jgi:opacity protein-like surface antigen
MMQHMKGLLLAAAPLALAAAGTAFAQAYYAPPVIVPQFFLDGGPSFTVGHTSDYLNTGWTVGGGFQVRPDPAAPFSLRAEVNYSRFGATNQLLNEGSEANQTQITGGYGETVDGQIDGVLEAPLAPFVRGYVTGGVGVAWRRIELNQYGSYPCDGFLGVCGPQFVTSTSNTVATYDTTRFAWNVGAGLNFPLPAGESWFVEARYERIETPTPTEFLPIRFGIRF